MIKNENSLVNFVKKSLNGLGIDVVKYQPQEKSPYPVDFDRAIIETISYVKPFTRTSPERIFMLCEAVKYIVNNDIPGDIVECGVWKGGSMMVVAKTLLSMNNQDKNLYLFDTFDGMTEPGEQDVNFQGIDASKLLDESLKDDEKSVWCNAPVDEVRQAMNDTGYDSHKIHLLEGRVEDTIPEKAPEEIALLRLDTDWYESTRHELIHLFPRLASGGVIIIDDYGHWQGARQAVDEYIRENRVKILLNRIDYTGRIGVVFKS
jgi:O-methyltransferase